MGIYRVGRSYYFRFRFKGQHVRKAVGPVPKRLAERAEDAERKRLRTRWVAQRFGVEDDTPLDGHVPTLAAYIRQTYLPTHLPTLAPTSQVQARSLCGKLTRDLGHVRLDELVPAVLDRWKATRFERDKVSRAQVANDARFLSSVINHARRQRVITAHPMRGWRWPVADPARYHIITRAEERALKASAGDGFRPWLALALHTGLRKDELRLLQQSHVDHGVRELRLMQPKVRRVKVIPLEAPTLRLLEQLARQARAHETSYLLAGPGGRPFTIDRVNALWAQTRRRAQLPHIRFHDLRHTFATRALEAGGTPPEVGDMLGHKPPLYKMTWRYVHARAEGKRAAVRSMIGLRSGHRRRRRAG